MLLSWTDANVLFTLTPQPSSKNALLLLQETPNQGGRWQYHHRYLQGLEVLFGVGLHPLIAHLNKRHVRTCTHTVHAGAAACFIFTTATVFTLFSHYFQSDDNRLHTLEFCMCRMLGSDYKHLARFRDDFIVADELPASWPIMNDNWESTLE